jgi:hypothetical protein
MSATTDIDPDPEPVDEPDPLTKEAYSLMCTASFGSLMPRDFTRLEELHALGVEIPDVVRRLV